MSRILLVEDDPILGRGLAVALELDGYQVTWARDLRSAADFHDQYPSDLLLLDMNLPDGNGLTLLKKIRVSGSRLPVIVLTAKTDEESVVEGLQAGANDYVRKPFGNKELFARIKVALQLPQISDHQLKFGDVLIRVDQRRAMFGDVEILLKPREFDILHYFFQHAEAVVSRDSLIAAVNKDGEIYDRTIDSHISHVRARLKAAGAIGIKISSVYGIGYRLEKMA